MRLVLVCALLVLSGCFAPPGPMERLTNAAYELNSATRFGRMDVALSMVAADAQSDFMHRHASWHGDTRIVDLELRGMRMVAKEIAEVQLTVAWHRINDTEIRTSVISQKWTQGKSGWELAEEARVGGSPGIFGPDGGKAKRGKKARAGASPGPAPRLDGLTVSDWQ